MWAVWRLRPDQGPGAGHLRPQELRRGREGVPDILLSGHRGLHQEVRGRGGRLQVLRIMLNCFNDESL